MNSFFLCSSKYLRSACSIILFFFVFNDSAWWLSSRRIFSGKVLVKVLCFSIKFYLWIANIILLLKQNFLHANQFLLLPKLTEEHVVAGEFLRCNLKRLIAFDF